MTWACCDLFDLFIDVMKFNTKQSYQKAMELIKNDEWEKAHDIVQDMNTTMAAHIHAYLHRIEGDNWNADYWYRRAGRSRPILSLEIEWEQINELIDKE